MRLTPRSTGLAPTDAEFAALLAVPPGRRGLVLRNSRRCFALVEGLAAHCFSLRFRSLPEMLSAGRLAAEVAEELTPAQARRAAGEMAELRAHASAVYGNALRVAGDLPAAERTLTAAERHLRAGTGERRELEPLLLELIASLREAQEEYAEAHRLLARAADIRGELGDREGLGKVRIQQGIVFGSMGSPDRAVVVLVEAINLVERDRDLARSAFHSLAWYLVEAYRPERARAVLEQARNLLAEGDELIQLKAQWLEAKLAAAFQETAETARRHYEEARRGYTERGMHQEAAFISLDLKLLETTRPRHGTGFLDDLLPWLEP